MSEPHLCFQDVQFIPGKSIWLQPPKPAEANFSRISQREFNLYGINSKNDSLQKNSSKKHFTSSVIKNNIVKQNINRVKSAQLDKSQEPPKSKELTSIFTKF